MSAAWEKGSTRAWRRVRRLVLERDGYRCQLDGCGAYATHVDHIVPRSEGGALLDPANLRAACQRCNLSRGAGGTKLRRHVRRVGWSW